MAGCGDVDRASNMLPGGRKINESCSNTAPSLNVPECAICLQTCVHPVKLPCKHIFCFLCVKGASWQSRRCALCRQEIPEDFLDKPALLSPEELKAASRGNGENAWYYEGRNGWWQYDERTSMELEDAYLKGKKTIEMLIAGFLYVADLENMVQFRRNEHGRRRKIKRDIVDIPKKGVAGLRLDCDSNGLSSERENSADGADSAADTGSTAASVQPSVPTIRPSVMPTMAIPGQPLTLSPDTTVPLVSSFTQLQLQDQSTARSRRGEGEEQEDLVPTSRVITSQSAASLLYDGTESGTSSDSEDENTIQLQQSMSTNHSRQRLVPPSLETENEIPGGEPSLEEPSTSVGVREQQPDGQCTVTEV